MYVDEICRRSEIILLPEWVPRSINTEVDFLSRCCDSDDWAVLDWIFFALEQKWGHHSIDRFACDFNTKCQAFNSRFWCPNTSGINAFKQTWTGHVNWLVPPPRLIIKCIEKAISDRCTCTLIVPIWRSANYWPLIFPNGKDYASFIKDSFQFKPGVLTRRGRGRNGIFDGRPLKFGLMALRIETGV
jgi:hypothetical protein